MKNSILVILFSLIISIFLYLSSPILVGIFTGLIAGFVDGIVRHKGTSKIGLVMGFIFACFPLVALILDLPGSNNCGGCSDSGEVLGPWSVILLFSSVFLAVLGFYSGWLGTIIRNKINSKY